MDAIAHHRQVQGGAAIHETGRQSSQAAISQPGVGLLLSHGFERLAETLQRFLRGRFQAKIKHVVGQGPANQEFQRQVIRATLVGLIALGIGVHPVRHEPVTQRPRQGLIGIDRRAAMKAPEVIKLVALKILGQRLATIRQLPKGNTAGGNRFLFLFWYGHFR